MVVRRSARLGLALGLCAACSGPQELPCEEPTDGAPALERVPLVVGGTEVSAEVAEGAARQTAWAGRRCDLDALVWVPDQVGPAAVVLCEVEVAVDLAFVRQGEVVAVALDVPPCDGPCDACPAYGEQGPAVDAVLWLPAGQVAVMGGDFVTGLEAVALPTE